MQEQFNGYQLISLSALQSEIDGKITSISADLLNLNFFDADTFTNSLISGSGFGSSFEIRGSGFESSNNPKVKFLKITSGDSTLEMSGNVVYSVNNDTFKGTIKNISLSDSTSSFSATGQLKLSSSGVITGSSVKSYTYSSSNFSLSASGNFKLDGDGDFSGGTVKSFSISDSSGHSLSISGAKINAKFLGSANSMDDIFNAINSSKALQGNDQITADDFANTLNGFKGKDTILGNGGNDTINGGAGKDTLFGGNGNDVLTGGADKDIFVFNTTLDSASNVDTITDFTHKKDSILLSQSFFNSLSAGKLASSDFVIGSGVTASDSSDHILYDTSTGGLFYDADGNGAIGAVQFATLSNVPSNITASDFTIS